MIRGAISLALTVEDRLMNRRATVAWRRWRPRHTSARRAASPDQLLACRRRIRGAREPTCAPYGRKTSNTVELKAPLQCKTTTPGQMGCQLRQARSYGRNGVVRCRDPTPTPRPAGATSRGASSYNDRLPCTDEGHRPLRSSARATGHRGDMVSNCPASTDRPQRLAHAASTNNRNVIACVSRLHTDVSREDNQRLRRHVVHGRRASRRAHFTVARVGRFFDVDLCVRRQAQRPDGVIAPYTWTLLVEHLHRSGQAHCQLTPSV